MKQRITFIGILLFIGLLGSFALSSAENEPENTDCDAGTQLSLIHI